jgi:AraC-like DNA-binding protein/quercetin dioxygenase-like cupin family protein
MDDTLLKLDDHISVAERLTHVIASYFHTPGEADRRLFHAVVRAGHIRAAPDYRVDRRSYPGHDLLFCLAGSGTLRSGNRSFAVSAGQLGWIDCKRPHAHWPDPADPWELLWMRVDSPQMNRLADALNIESDPVFTLRRFTDAASIYDQVFMLLRDRSLTLDAALHAAVSALIALLFEARQGAPPLTRRQSRDAPIAPELGAVLARMRVDYRRAWSVKDLAELAGVSVPHFFRCFARVTGSSPIDWLRRERINHAKRQLTETRDRIRDIAERVGYNDAFYFSRDFRKLVGMSPRQYRDRERALREAAS